MYKKFIDYAYQVGIDVVLNVIDSILDNPRMDVASLQRLRKKFPY